MRRDTCNQHMISRSPSSEVEVLGDSLAGTNSTEIEGLQFSKILRRRIIIIIRGGIRMDGRTDGRMYRTLYPSYHIMSLLTCPSTVRTTRLRSKSNGFVNVALLY